MKKNEEYLNKVELAGVINDAVDRGAVVIADRLKGQVSHDGEADTHRADVVERLTRIETTMCANNKAMLTSNEKMVKTLDDHEIRVRGLEKRYWGFAGGSVALAGAASFIGWAVSLAFGGD